MLRHLSSGVVRVSPWRPFSNRFCPPPPFFKSHTWPRCCPFVSCSTLAVRSLARWIYASSVVSAVIVVAMIVFGIYSSDQENQIYTIFVAVSLTLALATALYGALMRDRGFLMLSFVLHLWSVWHRRGVGRGCSVRLSGNLSLCMSLLLHHSPPLLSFPLFSRS